MALTEEQFDVWWKENGIESATFAEKSAARKGWKAAIAALPKPDLRAICIADENTFMMTLADRIVGNANPEEDSRLDVAYAIARHLNLDWPSAYEALITQPASAPSDQNPVPTWIEWSGGDCPIKPGEEFKVRLANGEEFIGEVGPEWNWSHDDPSCEPIIAYCIVSKPEPPTPQPDYKAQRDAERLDFLDKNRSMNMGWSCGVAPAGNVSITSVICGKLNIREAIDAAIASVKGGA